MSMKCVYKLEGLDSDEMMAIRFGLNARLKEIEDILEKVGSDYPNRQYWLDEKAIVEKIDARWFDANFRSFEYVEVSDKIPAATTEEENIPF